MILTTQENIAVDVLALMPFAFNVTAVVLSYLFSLVDPMILMYKNLCDYRLITIDTKWNLSLAGLLHQNKQLDKSNLNGVPRRNFFSFLPHGFS